MRGRHILYLDEEKLTAYRWSAGNVVVAGVFAANDAGLAEFAGYLRGHARSRFTLLANLGDETYHTITLPRLPFHERRAVIERKLAQHFHACRLVAAASLGPRNRRHREEPILLAALDTRSRLTPWIDAIAGTGTLLCSVHSLPFVAGRLAAQLSPADFSGLLLTMQDESLRETYFESGSLRFSRRVSIDGLRGTELAQLIALETVRLQHYLFTQQLIDAKSALRCLVIVGTGDLAAVRSHCVDTAAIAFDLRSTDECAQQIGLKQPPESSRIDAAFVHLLAVSPPATQFADHGLRRQYRTQQLRTAIFAGASVVLSTCVAIAGQRWSEGRAYEMQTAQLLAEARELRQRALANTTPSPTIPIAANSLRRIAALHDELTAEENLPNSFLADVAQVLDRSPAIDIYRLSWNRPSPLSAESAGRQQNLVLHGAITTPNGSPADRHQALNRLAAALQENPRLRVGIGKLVSEATGEDGGEGTDAARNSRRFTIELTWNAP